MLKYLLKFSAGYLFSLKNKIEIDWKAKEFVGFKQYVSYKIFF